MERKERKSGQQISTVRHQKSADNNIQAKLFM